MMVEIDPNEISNNLFRLINSRSQKSSETISKRFFLKPNSCLTCCCNSIALRSCHALLILLHPVQANILQRCLVLVLAMVVWYWDPTYRLHVESWAYKLHVACPKGSGWHWGGIGSCKITKLIDVNYHVERIHAVTPESILSFHPWRSCFVQHCPSLESPPSIHLLHHICTACQHKHINPKEI